MMFFETAGEVYIDGILNDGKVKEV